VQVAYRTGSGRALDLDLEPWAVVVRHGLWYLLCWSHTAGARRVLRIDRVRDVRALSDAFTPPDDLDPVRMLEEQLSQGWRHEIEVLVDAPVERVRHWIPRTVGRLEPVDGGRTRLLASTDELNWYAEMLGFVRAPFHVVRPAALRAELAAMAERLRGAADDTPAG
jgi:predicted DNA-binding transcriptional regulator YafY